MNKKEARRMLIDITNKAWELSEMTEDFNDEIKASLNELNRCEELTNEQEEILNFLDKVSDKVDDAKREMINIYYDLDAFID